MEHQLYALVGDEPVRRRQLLARLRAQSGASEQLSAASVSPEQAASGNLLADPDRPLLRVVNDYPKWTAAERKRFAAMSAELTPGLVLVLVVKQLGAKDPLRAAIAADAVVSVKAPAAGEFADWVTGQAQIAGGQMQPAAARELVARAGENCERLASEVDKLVISADGEPVTVELVRALVDAELRGDAWAWVEALFAGDAKGTFGRLAELEAAGAAPLALTGALSSRLLPLAWLHVGATAEQVNVKPYPWRKAGESRSAGWDAARTLRTLHRLARCETQLKGESLLPEWTVMARFCAEQLADTPHA